MDDGPFLGLLIALVAFGVAVAVLAYKGGQDDGRQEQCEYVNPDATRCIMEPDGDFYVPVIIFVKEG